MTTFFGMIDFSGRPLEQASVEAMRDATRANPGDVERAWHDKNAALGCNLRWITPESESETLPLARQAPGGSRVITACARIDNRKELGDKLGISANAAKGVSDSEFILRAYEKWGDSCVDHLLGDFAFAILDSAAGRLFCARDHMGIQPLFYRKIATQLVFANSLEPLILDCFPATVLKNETVARYLRDGENYSPTDTFFENIFQLPPGSFLVADATGVAVKRYWSLEQVPPLRLDGIDDYCEMLFELLKDSVRSRLRSQYRMGAHLSGGLDSASIVACAGTMGTVDVGNMTTFNWLYTPQLEAEKRAPEWSMGREIAETYQLPHLYTDSTVDDMLSILCQHDIALGDTVDVWSEKSLARNASSMGIRTMLSGWGGDQLISHYGNDVYAERVLRGDLFSSLWELLRVTRRNGSMTLYPRNLYRMILHPLYRSFTSPNGLTIGGRSATFLDYALPELLSSAKKVEPLLRYKGVRLRNQQLCQLQRAHLHNRVNSWAVSGRKLGLSYVYPLLDKRLVDMALGVPAELFRKNDIPRYLLKRSVKNLEPHGLWVRNQKSEPYRVEKAAVNSVQAAKIWSQKAQAKAGGNPFIDEVRLVAEIDSLNYHKPTVTPEFYRNLMAINRSILVLGLSSHI
jgi:asparagine synthase (glutamine-hydrolysing)